MDIVTVLNIDGHEPYNGCTQKEDSTGLICLTNVYLTLRQYHKYSNHCVLFNSL